MLIEVGARSQTEPYKQVKLKSIVDEQYPDSAFTEEEFVVNTVIPEKTLLEKLILLHEEFSKPEEKIRYRRMSRHYYDIGQILKTYLGEKALINSELFQSIIHHRAKFTPIKTINYDTLYINNLSIIPSAGFYDLYKKDYSEMQENMIYGDSLNFEELINYIQSKI